MTLRYQASCVLDKPRGCRQQVLPVWGSERRRLAPIDFPAPAARFRSAEHVVLVAAVLLVGWLLVLLRRLSDSVRRARSRQSKAPRNAKKSNCLRQLKSECTLDAASPLLNAWKERIPLGGQRTDDLARQ